MVTAEIGKIHDIHLALKEIDGHNILSRIEQLAAVGNLGKGGSRLALSEEEVFARKLIGDWMGQAGMTVDNHPFGLVGTLRGSNGLQNLIILGSHFDTVPAGGMYDGSLGIVGAIEVVRILNEINFIPDVGLQIAASSLEESSRFGKSCLGSKGMLFGFNNDILKVTDGKGISIGQAIANMGFRPKETALPVLFPKGNTKYIELHIEQGQTLERNGWDVAAVEAIAAADRRRINVGRVLPKNNRVLENTEGYKITIFGKSSHSGGTPMGIENRADGLQPTADIILDLADKYDGFKWDGVEVIANVKVSDQALNKIPGKTSLEVIFSGGRKEDVESASRVFKNTLGQIKEKYARSPLFMESGRVLDMEALTAERVARLSNESLEMMPPLKTAALVIKGVEEIAAKYAHGNVVGTIGTLDMDRGIIKLGLDVRGIYKESRDNAVSRILGRLMRIEDDTGVDIRHEEISIEDPVILDRRIVEVTEQSAVYLGLRCGRINSAAGHDAQNFPKAGMIFIPSRNGGISHNPYEYSTTTDLVNGIRTLGLVTAMLSVNSF